MGIVTLIIQVIAVVIGCVVAILSIPLFIRFRWPAAMMWMLKLFVSSLSLVLASVGLLIGIAGLTTGSILISAIGIYDVLVFSIYIYRVTRPPASSSGFEKAFGLDWEKSISAEQKNHFLPSRRIFRLPVVPKARFEQNISFGTIPGTDRKLLCDIWQPPVNITPSGLAFIYLHGSAWYMLDKDCGTRPFFSHLAAQGHVIMDVAYRLAPETDMMGMIHDAKRAIAWIKENADVYGVNPDQIVIGGGSAGAHLALMAAYSANHPWFTPSELAEKDLSVYAVISLYGPTDLEPMYYHTNQHLTTRSIPGRPKKAVPAQMPSWMIKSMGKDYHRLGFDKGLKDAGTLATLLGGHPDECPETYALFSPVTHIHAHCPPTLLMHGEHDVMVPVKTIRHIYTLLLKEKVPVVMHLLPQTDHAFDLLLPEISPSAHSTFYDVERFLALQVKTSRQPMNVVREMEEHQLNF